MRMCIKRLLYKIKNYLNNAIYKGRYDIIYKFEIERGQNCGERKIS